MKSGIELRDIGELEWNEVLHRFTLIKPDIYYFPQYYATWQAYERAQPTCLYACLEDIDFIYPFFLKPISGYNLEQTYYDVFTAYGYGGLLSSIPDPPRSVVSKINSLIDEWFCEKRVVSEFIRENRVFDFQDRYLRDVTHVKVRTNVYSNLKNHLKEELSKSRKRYLNIARREGLTYTIDEHGKYIEIFIKIYVLTMKKVNASQYYYFDKEHFDSVFDLLRGKAEMLLVWQGSKLLAGALCFRSGNHFIYHLGASDPGGLNSKPNDFLFYSIMERGKALGFRFVFFGGGTTDASEDTLFQFKSKFGSLRYPCHIGRKVHLPDIYKKLCSEWKTRHPELYSTYGHMLQKYRYTS